MGLCLLVGSMAYCLPAFPNRATAFSPSDVYAWTQEDLQKRSFVMKKKDVGEFAWQDFVASEEHILDEPLVVTWWGSVIAQSSQTEMEHAQCMLCSVNHKLHTRGRAAN